MLLITLMQVSGSDTSSKKRLRSTLLHCKYFGGGQTIHSMQSATCKQMHVWELAVAYKLYIQVATKLKEKLSHIQVRVLLRLEPRHTFLAERDR